MKIVFTDTFYKSLKRITRSEKFPFKQWEILRYGVPNFFKNLWFFRRELYDFHWYDSRYALMMFKKGLEPIASNLKIKGNEEVESKNKKIEKIERLIFLLDCQIKDDYIEFAEKELGPLEEWDGNLNFKISESDRKIYRRADEIEKEHWKEMWEIVSGKDFPENCSEEEYQKLFDGSDLRGWWD